MYRTNFSTPKSIIFITLTWIFTKSDGCINYGGFYEKKTISQPHYYQETAFSIGPYGSIWKIESRALYQNTGTGWTLRDINGVGCRSRWQDVSVVSANDIWLISGDARVVLSDPCGRVYQYNTDTYVTTARGMGSNPFTKVSAAEDGTVYVIDTAGYLYKWCGGDNCWSKQSGYGTEKGYEAISVGTENHVWALKQGEAYQISTTHTNRGNAPNGKSFEKIDVGSNGVLMALASDHTLWNWNTGQSRFDHVCNALPPVKGSVTSMEWITYTSEGPYGGGMYAVSKYARDEYDFCYILWRVAWFVAESPVMSWRKYMSVFIGSVFIIAIITYLLCGCFDRSGKQYAHLNVKDVDLDRDAANESEIQPL